MRSFSMDSLLWIASVCLLSGCYSPWMYPRQGYGYGYGNSSPYYGGQYLGGSQGIQTLPPGSYYAPGSIDPGAVAPNSLQPTPDDGSGGAGGAGGGEAPVYNPGANTPSSRPAPTYDDVAPGSGLEEPETEGPVQQNNAGGFPGAMSEPSPSTNWAEGSSIETASMKADQSDIERTGSKQFAEPDREDFGAERSGEMDGAFEQENGTTESEGESLKTPEALDETAETDDEAPPLLKVP